MATLSQMCELPQRWLASFHAQEVRMSKKMSWRDAKKAEHQRMLEYFKREQKRHKAHQPLSESRRVVREQTMPEQIILERGAKMFGICKGRSTPKKARNTASKEQAGTIGSVITVRRFQNSRLTCVCKTKIY